MENNKTWFTCHYAAKETGLSDQLITYYCKQGKIKWQFIDGKIQVPLEEVKRLRNGKLPGNFRRGVLRPSKINIYPDHIGIIANNTGNEFMFDLDMRDIAKEHGWSENGSGYLGARIASMPMSAHYLVIGIPPEGYIVDHRDRNRKNNKRNNLRFITISQNAMNSMLCSNNSSGFRGVSWDKNRKKWHASLRHFGKTLNIGRFSSAVEAAVAYDRKVFELFGDIAMTNKKMGLIS